MTSSDDLNRVPYLIREVYGIVRKFEEIFPGRHFTPDCHLVGSLGESLAAYMFDLELMTASNEGYDAETRARPLLKVEIKTTQDTSKGRRILLSSEVETPPDRLLVLELCRNGSLDVVYNGPGAAAWDAAGPKTKTSTRSISLTTLREIERQLDPSEKLPELNPLPEMMETDG